MVSPASGLTANLSADPATSDTAPAWSPDGSRVAFQRSGPTDGIWTMDATGGDLAFVPTPTTASSRPGRPTATGSPSAATAAATPSCGWSAPTAATSPSSPTTATRTGRPAGPRTAPASPSPARARAARPASCCWTWAPAARSPSPGRRLRRRPDWSPDGKRIAFYRFLPGEGNRVFTVAPSGKALTQRTFGGGPTAFNDVHPAWSPDGARIGFARGGDQDDGLPFHIHTVTVATGTTAQVTSGRVVDLLPSWQPL